MDWQPIETAPKDGAPVLVAFQTYERGFWSFTVARWDDDMDGSWVLNEPGSNAEDANCWPTHWMPLPDPPKINAEK